MSALDELHCAGALHRDVKPGNVTVELTDTSVHATLLDLGIVNITYEKGVTAVSHFLGSKHWAPIEQLMGEPLDERSDLYSLGAVAYNALTNQEPYAGSATEAAVAVNMGRSQLVLPALRDLPEEVAEMITACLAYRRDDRPGSARDCLVVLERHI
jgi:serine/threonine protein kinase